MSEKESLGFLNEDEVNKICNEIIDDTIDMFMPECSSCKNLIVNLCKMPIAIRDAYYWSKFYMFVQGVRKIEQDPKQNIKLSTKLFGTPTDKKKNGMRLLGYIDKADTEEKINYYINATRSLLLGSINVTCYFRIMKAISETLSDDLEYLANDVIDKGTLPGNVELLALERTGLVMQEGIDANKDIQSQNYIVSDLGYWVDKYAVSLENDERQKFYKRKNEEIVKPQVNLQTMSNEDIDKIFE